MRDIAAERDLYRGLLELAAVTDIRAFLTGACSLLCASTAADAALIGIYRGMEPVGVQAAGLTPERESRVLAHLSTGVLETSLRSGDIVRTSSALLDDRFEGNESVRRNRIEAVLCVPVPLPPPLRGVVYVQRRAGGGPFSNDEEALLVRIADHLVALGRTALGRADDATQAARKRLAHCDLIGTSAALGALLDQVATVSPLPLDVLLTGPTGTGKSHLARLIHDNSPRATGPFVAVNCAAIPTELFEAELYGAAAGAYTGSQGTREGFVGQAAGGTLFLDEVTELPAPAQAKLLHFLQGRTYTRVGDPVARSADVRVLAATNRPLDAAVESGTFRADLRYRLEVLPLRVPPLSERPEDLPVLAQHFLTAANDRMPELGRSRFSPGAIEAIAAAEWPGNVRQLQHTIEAARVRAHAAGLPHVQADHLFPSSDAAPLTWQAATRAFQRDLLRRTLARTGGNVAEAARELDLARSHAYDLVKAFGLRDG